MRKKSEPKKIPAKDTKDILAQVNSIASGKSNGAIFILNKSELKGEVSLKGTLFMRETSPDDVLSVIFRQLEVDPTLYAFTSSFKNK